MIVAGENDDIVIPASEPEQLFEKPPLDTAQMLEKLDQKAKQLAGHMKTALETKNGAGIREELSENIRVMIAMHKAGGDGPFLPTQLNPDKFRTELQKLEKDPAVRLFVNAVLSREDNYKTFMQNAARGSDGLEDVVMPTYQKARAEVKAQEKKAEEQQLQPPPEKKPEPEKNKDGLGL